MTAVVRSGFTRSAEADIWALRLRVAGAFHGRGEQQCAEAIGLELEFPDPGAQPLAAIGGLVRCSRREE